MTSDRIQVLRNARQSESVILQEYNNFRSTRPGKKIFAFEGFDDVVFYEVMLGKLGFHEIIDAFVCKGKDKVFSLRRLLSRNLSEDSNKVLYFIDKDFDGMKGNSSENNTYCTCAYAIENYLIGQDVLEKILNGDFRCFDDLEERGSIIEYFNDMFGKFFHAMKDVNTILFFARKNGVIGIGVEDNLDNYIKISKDNVNLVGDLNSVIASLGLNDVISNADIPDIREKVEAEFSQLDPLREWRGKWNIAFFQKMLKILKEDRCQKHPKIFKKKKSIGVNFDGNLIRQLSSACNCPEKLKVFFQNNSLV